jgi:hypothetical protein
MTRRTFILYGALLCCTRLLKGDDPKAPSSGWHDAHVERVGGREITLSKPVLVARSSGFLWFPTIMRLASGDLLAVMSNYHDDHVEKATGALSWSGDGGLTWSKPSAGLYSDSAARTSSGDQLLLPYYLKPLPGASLGAPYQLVANGKREATVATKCVEVKNWPRPDRSFAPKLGLAGFVFNGNPIEIEGGHLTMLYGHFQDARRYSLVAAESKDGLAWRIRSTVADENCALTGEEGPCESAQCRLRDGRLMCVFRLASSVPYGQVFSADDGKTWTTPIAMAAGIGSVQPALATLEDGAIILTGGRPGLWAWINAGGDGKDWSRIDLRANHNAAHSGDPITDLATGTSAYTELVRLDSTQVLCIYDRLARGWSAIAAGSPETNSVWVVRMTVKPRRE